MSKRKKHSDKPLIKFNAKKTVNLRSYTNNKQRQSRKGNFNYKRSELKGSVF